MKILLIHNNYQQVGGEKAAVESQIELLRRHQHQVIPFIKESADIEGYSPAAKISLLARTLYSRQTYRQIRSLVEQERPDIAHVHNVFPLISPSVYRALAAARVPIIQTIHNFRFLCPNALFYTHGQICERCKHGRTHHAVRLKCYRQTYRLSALYALTIGLHRRWGTFHLIDRFIALTSFTAQKLVEGGLANANKISVLGNFLPDPLPPTGSFEHRQPYALYLGRLSAEKGVDLLLQAMAGQPTLQLKVAGTGPQQQSLRSEAQQRGLGQIEFLGHQTGEAKWRLLQQATVTVVPSKWYENFPIAVLESLAAGTPVLASNLGSLPFVVEDNRSGLLFRPDDSHDLQQKLNWFATHPQEALAMGRYGRDTVENSYSTSAFYQALMSIYNRTTSTPT